MASKPIITIIGLGLTGASMGLGLQREAGNFEIVGHDRSPEVAQAARKQGAVQRVEWNLHRAYEGAELVLFAVPFGELDELFGQMADDLTPGALVFAMTSLLQPAVETAAKRLPAKVHFVAGHPVLTGLGATPSVRADLFEQAVFALAAGIGTEPSAVQLASDFVERVGATPLFVDAQEHDGIISGVEHLPKVMGAALMRVSVGNPGWREARRLAGRNFAAATDVGQNAGALFQEFQANRQNLVYRIKQMQRELGEWAALLETTPAEGEKHPLLAALEQVVEERITWEAQALLQKWDAPPSTAQVTAEGSGFLRQMFFGNLMGKRNPTDPRR
jgi:prephenate dehydrogenase